MNIEKMILVPEGSDVARVYEWKENHLLMEELLAFLTVRGKLSDISRWIENGKQVSSGPKVPHDVESSLA